MQPFKSNLLNRILCVRHWILHRKLKLLFWFNLIIIILCKNLIESLAIIVCLELLRYNIKWWLYIWLPHFQRYIYIYIHIDSIWSVAKRVVAIAFKSCNRNALEQSFFESRNNENNLRSIWASWVDVCSRVFNCYTKAMSIVYQLRDKCYGK